MINIIAPDIKEQVIYAKRNVIVARYIGLAIVIAGFLGAGFWFIQSYANNQVAVADQRLQQHQEEVNQYQEIQEKVSAAEAQLDLVKQLLEKQTRFSILLEDLAAVLPEGVSIKNIALTGDSSQPLSITLATRSYEQAAITRNALLKSSRIEAADIQTVAQNEEGANFTAEITVSFTEEGAR